MFRYFSEKSEEKPLFDSKTEDVVWSQFVLETSKTTAEERAVRWQDFLGVMPEPVFSKREGDGFEKNPIEFYHELNADKEQRVRYIARKLNISAATFFYGVFLQVTAMLTGVNEIGSAIAHNGRESLGEDEKDSLGLFLRILPIGIGWQNGETLAPWLQKLQQCVAEAIAIIRPTLITNAKFVVGLITLQNIKLIRMIDCIKTIQPRL